MNVFARLILVLLPSLLLAGCVTSKRPLLSADTRVLPALPGTKVEIYERESSRAAWKKQEPGGGVLGANEALEVFPAGPDGKPRDNERYTFHPVGRARFIIQARLTADGPYVFSFMHVRDGEFFVTALDCAAIDRVEFEAAGGTVSDKEGCSLDTSPDPLGLLQLLIGDPKGKQYRYVPVK